MKRNIKRKDGLYSASLSAVGCDVGSATIRVYIGDEAAFKNQLKVKHLYCRLCILHVPVLFALLTSYSLSFLA